MPGPQSPGCALPICTFQQEAGNSTQSLLGQSPASQLSAQAKTTVEEGLADCDVSQLLQGFSHGLYPPLGLYPSKALEIASGH